MDDERSPGIGSRGGDDTTLSLSVAFDLLADGRRRHLLYRLAERNGPVPFSDLVSAVIETEEGAPAATDPADVDFLGEEYRRIALSIRSRHLPLLEGHGVIDYDRELRLIELSDDIGPLDGLLDVARRSDD